jgi:hypothetical protein
VSGTRCGWRRHALLELLTRAEEAAQRTTARVADTSPPAGPCDGDADAHGEDEREQLRIGHAPMVRVGLGGWRCVARVATLI